PIVDDAFVFGGIAAANALSDVYAMGGTPLLAINLAAFPAKELPLTILSDILRGGMEKAHEAGIDIVGGHSIDDPEPKYGLAVIGTVHPDRVVRNSTARAGDQLLLTKPIGTGIISTAIKHGVAPAVAEAAAIASMLQLNQAAAAAMTAVGVSAATDVTGFGLLGHLRTMARASGVSATVQAAAVPVLPGAEALADAGEVPGGTRSNERSLRTSVQWSDAVLPPRRILLCDAQTSGGLLMAVPPSAQPRLEAELAARGVAAYRIGDLHDGRAGTIIVR
ncbi:MAG: selenide, water dikinase SelD, partial [Chloroflexi bacterium]